MPPKRRDPYSAPLGVPPIFSASDIPTPTVPTQLPPPFDLSSMAPPPTQNVGGGEESAPPGVPSPDRAVPQSTMPSLPPSVPLPGDYSGYAAPPDGGGGGGGSTPAPPGGGGDFEDFLHNYWAPDRREVLVAMLQRDYWAPDRDEVIARYQNMSDDEMWPNGKPGDKNNPGEWSSDWFWSQWDKLIQQYPPTTAGLKQLIADHPELKIKLSGNGNIELPNGEFWDVIIGAGAGGGTWWKSRRGGTGGGGNQPPPGFGGPSDDDELTKAINKKLIELIGGEGEYMRRYESAREKEALSFKAMMEDARAEMASRGLLGEPGSPSGEEANAIRRVTERVAPTFARETRDAYIDSQNFLLNAINSGNARQQTLANIALGILDRNIEWNKFLANYGLDRERLQHDIQNGNLDQLMPMIQAFIEYLRTSQQGYQPPDR